MRAATIFLLLIAAVVSATPIGALYIEPVRGPRSIPDADLNVNMQTMSRGTPARKPTQANLRAMITPHCGPGPCGVVQVAPETKVNGCLMQEQEGLRCGNGAVR